MQELIGKKVEVDTFEITYNGVLVEIGDREIHLQSETGWIVIPLERVVDIRSTE